MGKSLVPKQFIPHTAHFLCLSVAPRVGRHMDFEGFWGRSWIETVRQRPQSETGACWPRNEHNSTGIQSCTPATLPPTPAKGAGWMGTLVKPRRGCPGSSLFWSLGLSRLASLCIYSICKKQQNRDFCSSFLLQTPEGIQECNHIHIQVQHTKHTFFKRCHVKGSYIPSSNPAWMRTPGRIWSWGILWQWLRGAQDHQEPVKESAAAFPFWKSWNQHLCRPCWTPPVIIKLADPGCWSVGGALSWSLWFAPAASFRNQLFIPSQPRFWCRWVDILPSLPNFYVIF